MSYEVESSSTWSQIDGKNLIYIVEFYGLEFRFNDTR